jgi:hypothetical protein
MSCFLVDGSPLILMMCSTTSVVELTSLTELTAISFRISVIWCLVSLIVMTHFVLLNTCGIASACHFDVCRVLS